MKPTSGWRWQAGFSLVELMVTMGIALLLLLGVSTVMLYNRQGFNAQKSLAHLQENARLAEFILANNAAAARSEEHTSELQSRFDLVCRLLLEKKKNKKQNNKQALVH